MNMTKILKIIAVLCACAVSCSSESRPKFKAGDCLVNRDDHVEKWETPDSVKGMFKIIEVGKYKYHCTISFVGFFDNKLHSLDRTEEFMWLDNLEKIPCEELDKWVKTKESI